VTFLINFSHLDPKRGKWQQGKAHRVGVLQCNI